MSQAGFFNFVVVHLSTMVPPWQRFTRLGSQHAVEQVLDQFGRRQHVI
jgi:hypothetical protein